MNVSEILTSVALLNFGRNKPTEKELEKHLSCLNMADNEIYITTVNSCRNYTELDLFFEDDQTYVTLPNNRLHAIYSGINRFSLSKDFYNYEKKINGQIGYSYYILGDKLYADKTNLTKKEDPIDNVEKKYVRLLITPNRKKLVVHALDLDLETDIPIYPENYRNILVFGTLYYLYLGYDGNMAHIDNVRRNYELYKENLTHYYMLEKGDR